MIKKLAFSNFWAYHTKIMNTKLSTAIYNILKPLIILMERECIAFGDFSRLTKQAFINVIEEELLASGQKATISRISIITGLTRREVATLRKAKAPKQEQDFHQNRAVRVISGWVADNEFCDKKGEAKPLLLQGKLGSFEALVARHSGDIPYRAMVNELIRIGAVELMEDGKVMLIRAVYVPSSSKEGKYDLLGEDVALLISTIKHNIYQPEEPRYQRKVCYDNIPQEHVEEFKALANKENQLLLIKLNAWLVEHDMDKQSSIKSEHPMKVGVGVYYFEE
jgi:hypothetical protein